MSILTRLTEGIVDRDLSKEGAALQNKWEQTGLLEGLTTDQSKNYMSRLLENQAKELLREASSMAAGDVEGFAAVAFPIVRRVFGGLIANDLVSVQPMSLPSGLIFFMDFTLNSDRGLGDEAGDSVYGGGRVGSEISGGVTLTGAAADEGFYNLNSGYSSPTGSATGTAATGSVVVATASAPGSMSAAGSKAIRYDPDLMGETNDCQQLSLDISALTPNINPLLNKENLIDINFSASTGAELSGSSLVRRLTTLDGDTLTLTFRDVGGDINDVAGTLSYPLKDQFTDGGALGSVVGTDPWGLEGAGESPGPGTFNGEAVDAIPEIDIKVDSVAVTAITKKLKAKWSPELGQDLNAYHNLDAEVELTSILSEQIAL